MPAKPTQKQAKAMELIREGKTPRSAMLTAGYTEDTASHPSENLLRTPGAQSIIAKYQDAYLRVGITQDYMAAKTKELLEAEMLKTSLTEPDQWVPDNKTRLEALKVAREDMGLAQREGSLTPLTPPEGGSITVTWKDGRSL